MRSVLSQGYGNLELILVNDGSTDGSLELCRSLAGQDPRIVVLDKPNGGEASARNAGIDAATGDYIHVIDQDDELAPGMYADMMGYANLEPDVIKCGYRTVRRYSYMETMSCHPCSVMLDRDYIVNEVIPYTIETSFNPDKKFSGHWSMLVKRELLRDNSLRYDEDLPKMNDSKFIVDVLSHAKSVVFVEGAYYRWIRRDESLTSHYSNMFAGIVEVTQYYEQLFSGPEYGYDFQSRDKLRHNVKFTLDSMELVLAHQKHVNVRKELIAILSHPVCVEWFRGVDPYDAITAKMKKSMVRGNYQKAALQFTSYWYRVRGRNLVRKLTVTRRGR